jgi:predicted CXXCH cytochrome family protein
MSCHRSHLGEGKALLVKPGAALCFTCHDRAPFERTNRHKALDQGCATCHDPHGSDQGRLLTKDVNALCMSCHKDMSKHLHRVDGMDKRTGLPLTCVGCHDPHSSDQEALLHFEPKRELCLQCHAEAMSSH